MEKYEVIFLTKFLRLSGYLKRVAEGDAPSEPLAAEAAATVLAENKIDFKIVHRLQYSVQGDIS